MEKDRQKEEKEYNLKQEQVVELFNSSSSTTTSDHKTSETRHPFTGIEEEEDRKKNNLLLSFRHFAHTR